MSKSIFSNKSAVSNVVGYLMSFTIATILMASSITITNSILDDKTKNVAEIQAKSIADKVADGIIDAVAVTQSMPNADYLKVIDIPRDFAGFMGRRSYYVDVTEDSVIVTSTDGAISERSTNFNTGELGIGLSGRLYSGSGSLEISYNAPEYEYKFDLGTGNSIKHSPVKPGYFLVTENSILDSESCDTPWIYPDYKYRIPILINNSSPSDLEGNITSENLTDFPVRIVLNPSFFDYSQTDVTQLSSECYLSDLVFYDGDNISDYPESGNVVYVDASNSGGVGLFNDPFDTIQGGIDAASAGYIVYIFDGTYNQGSISISTEGIHIIGESRDGVIVSGGIDVIQINAEKITLNSLTVTGGSNAGIKIGSTFPSVTPQTNTAIINCDIKNNPYGVYIIEGSDYTKIINCDIHDNTVDGIHTRDVSGSSSSNNIIEMCNIYNNIQKGIYLGSNSDNNIIRDSDIYNNENGITLFGSDADNGADNNKIIRSNIYQNKRSSGIKIQDSNKNTVYSCDITENEEGAWPSKGIEFVGSTSDNLVYNNNIYENTIQAGSAGSTSWNTYYPIGGNYWGDDEYSAQGIFDIDGDGIGDTPYTIGGQLDNYPLMDLRANDKPGLPYCIDRWNPDGDSIIQVLVDNISFNSSKYIWLYYGYDGTLDNRLHNRSLADPSIFFNCFNKPLSNVAWTLSDEAIKDNIEDGSLNLNHGEYIRSNYVPFNTVPLGHGEGDSIPVGDLPINENYYQESQYITEAKLKVNAGNGSLIHFMKVLNAAGVNFQNYFQNFFISRNKSASGDIDKLRLHRYIEQAPNSDSVIPSEEQDTTVISSYSDWILFRSYMKINNTLYIFPQLFNMALWTRNISLDVYLNDADTRAYLGHVFDSYLTIPGLFIGMQDMWDPFPNYVYSEVFNNNNTIGFGSGIIPGSENDNILVDWVRVLKSTAKYQPTIEYGSTVSNNYGWLVSKSSTPSGGVVSSDDTGFNPSDPFQPDKLLRDYIIPETSACLIIKDLTSGVYTITITSGSAIKITTESYVQVRMVADDMSISSTQTSINLPATEIQEFNTAWVATEITSLNSGLALCFEGNVDVAISSITIERGGVKGIRVANEGEPEPGFEPNTPPTIPDTPSCSDPDGSFDVGTIQTFTTSATDSDGDGVQYQFDWGDGSGYSSWTDPPVVSGVPDSLENTWSSSGNFVVKAQARDEHGDTSGWSPGLSVDVINTPPLAPSNPSPSPDEPGVSIPPILSVDVSDPNMQTMSVTFYNASPPNDIIGTVSGIASGGRASVVWNNLDYNIYYRWYAKANDGEEDSPTSSTWGFWTGGAPISTDYYCFDRGSGIEEWDQDPAFLWNCDENWYAMSRTIGDIDYSISNTCVKNGNVDIQGVFFRLKGYYVDGGDIIITPLFRRGANRGDSLELNILDSESWIELEITDDTNNPDPWNTQFDNWDSIKDLMVEVKAVDLTISGSVFCSQVEIKVTYI